MSKAWNNDLLATEHDAESFISEDMLDDYHQNGECLITQALPFRFPQVQTTGNPSSYQTLVSVPIFIPMSAATDDGNLELILRFEAWCDSGSTARLLHLPWNTGSFDITATTPTWVSRSTGMGTWVRTNLYTPQEASTYLSTFMTFQAYILTGGGEFYIRALGSATRLLRAA